MMDTTLAEQVLQYLMDHELYITRWGGDTYAIECLTEALFKLEIL